MKIHPRRVIVDAQLKWEEGKEEASRVRLLDDITGNNKLLIYHHHHWGLRKILPGSKQS